VDKKISVLSGGERARVALARLLIRPGHLLLMDEPTNHLDLESSESLAEALAEFEGTLIFVSHNRSLIRKLATTVWNIEDGQVEAYGGTLDEYMHSCALRREALESPASVPAALSSEPEVGAVKRGGREDAKARRRREAEARKARNKIIGPLEKKVARLEERISEIETEQAERSSQLSDPAVYDDSERRNTLLKEFQEAAEKIEELTGRWEHAQEELEAAQAEVARLEADDE
jgi:ATP-binding cassette subfamily F protein 3